MSADTIVPSAGNPQSLNRFSYVLGNPLRYVDPSGHCIPGVNCPGDRFSETGGMLDGDAGGDVDGIFEASGDNATQALIGMFESPDLPGKTAAGRLEWILEHTEKVPPIIAGVPVLYTGESRFTGEGLKPELRDDDFYATCYGGKQTSRQIGHFLTAAAYGNWTGDSENRKLLVAEAMVGHELFSDMGGAPGVPFQLYLGSQNPSKAQAFLMAAELYDNEEARELLLSEVGYMGVGYPEIGGKGRCGNSMADLRLSALGYNFGQAIYHGGIKTRVEAADWLRTNIAE